MMSQALTSSTTPSSSSSFSFTLPPTLSSADGTTSVNYFTIIEKYKLEERTMNRLQELKHGNTLSDLSTSSSSFRYSSGTGTGSAPTTGTSRSSGSRPIDISFRDIVEEFATRNNVEFIQKLNPKTGETMHTMDGKVLWEFNHVVCYIDNNVLYVKRRRDEGSGGSGSGGSSGVGGGEWYPISFDDILELSKIIKK